MERGVTHSKDKKGEVNHAPQEIVGRGAHLPLSGNAGFEPVSGEPLMFVTRGQ